MFRPALALILSSALGVTTFAAPAQAEIDEGLLAALGAAAVIGLALNVEHNRKDKKKSSTTSVQEYQEYDDTSAHQITPAHGSYYYPKNGNAYGHQNPKNPHYNTSKSLPLKCLVNTRESGNRKQVFSYQCLAKSGAARDLPKKCATWVKTKSGQVPGYNAQCLVNRGYVIGNSKY